MGISPFALFNIVHPLFSLGSSLEAANLKKESLSLVAAPCQVHDVTHGGSWVSAPVQGTTQANLLGSPRPRAMRAGESWRGEDTPPSRSSEEARRKALGSRHERA